METEKLTLDECINLINRDPHKISNVSYKSLIQHPEICLEALLKDKYCAKDLPYGIEDKCPQVKAMLEIIDDWETIRTYSDEFLSANPQLCVAAYKNSKRQYKPSKKLLLNNAKLVECFNKHLADFDPIYNSLDSEEFLIETKDANYIKDCFKRRETYFPGYLSYNNIEKNLINALADIDNITPQEVMEDIIYNMDEYNLPETDAVSLITNTHDINFIKRIISSRDVDNLSSHAITNIVINSNNLNLIRDCISDPQEYGINEDDFKKLKEFKYENIDYIINEFKKSNSSYFDKNKKIAIPDEMTVGIEIESLGTISREMYQLIFDDLNLNDWEILGDGSLSLGHQYDYDETYGMEMTSSSFSKEDSFEKQIYDVCKILKLGNNTINDTCGGHIHVGADYLDNLDSWINLIEIWANTENDLYIISNEEGITPRNEVPEYAKPISKQLEEKIEEENLKLNEASDTYEIKECLRDMQIDKTSERTYTRNRYYGLNFYNLGMSDNNTLEFRISNGTLNPETWIENINLFGGILKACNDLSVIQNKYDYNVPLTEKEIKKLESFENLRTLENTAQNDEKKLKYLLDLVFEEYDDKKIYYNRYEANKNCKRVVEDTKPIIIDRYSDEYRTYDNYELSNKAIQLTFETVDLEMDKIKEKEKIEEENLESR